MNIQPNDVLTMKKNHPCGENKMLVLRSGVDFRVRCLKCSREFIIPRSKLEKNVKQVSKPIL
ncbi:MAG: DUF951 domain-containing protein [Ruminococcus sp.]|nr:DUF951 domain-containing protein [Ruminococcus sp.]